MTPAEQLMSEMAEALRAAKRVVCGVGYQRTALMIDDALAKYDARQAEPCTDDDYCPGTPGDERAEPAKYDAQGPCADEEDCDHTPCCFDASPPKEELRCEHGETKSHAVGADRKAICFGPNGPKLPAPEEEKGRVPRARPVVAKCATCGHRHLDKRGELGCAWCGCGHPASCRCAGCTAKPTTKVCRSCGRTGLHAPLCKAKPTTEGT